MAGIASTGRPEFSFIANEPSEIARQACSMIVHENDAEGKTVVRSSCLELPPNFDDYGWEVEAKGWFSEARIIASGRRYQIIFYDQARLGQEIQDELARGRAFFEPNLVVVQSVTRAHMEAAAEELVRSGEVHSLVAEP
jgi:hypothetical protein